MMVRRRCVMLPAAVLCLTALPQTRAEAPMRLTVPSMQAGTSGDTTQPTTPPPQPGDPGDAAPSEPAGKPVLTLEEAMEIALARNRTLIATRLNGGIAEAGVKVAGQRPNPDLELQASKDTPKESLIIAWPIETAGKRGKRIDVSEAGVRRVASETRQAVAAMRNQVRRAYYSLAAAQERLAQLEESGSIAKRAANAAQERFEAGQVPRLEALKGSLAATQTENDIDLARASLLSARSDLEVLLGGDPTEPVTVSHDLAEGSVPDMETARRMAEQANLDLQVLDGRIAEAKARVELARANQHPDPVLQGGVLYDNEPDWLWGWQAGVSITLPIMTRHTAEVRTEELTLESLVSQREALAATVDAAVISAASVAGAKRAAYLRYRDEIFPRAQEVESMAEDSYKEGRTGQVDLLQSIQFLNDIRARSVQAGLDYQIALADLEHAIGAPLP